MADQSINQTALAYQEKLKHELQNKLSSLQFQQLVDALLGHLLDIWIVGAESGFQHGADAGTAGQQDRRLRFECKKYGDTSHLNQRQLLGEIDQALLWDRALEGWILVATRSVPEQIWQALVQHGEALGVPIVIIDWRANEVAPLAALCASAPDIVEQLLSKNAGKVARSLRAVSGNEIDQLKRALQPWHLGFQSLRQLSHDKLDKLWNSREESKAVFGHDVAGGAEEKKVKRPSVLQGLNGWWQGGASIDAPVTVVGFDGTGKTWAVLDWLIDGKSEQPIVLIVPSSAVSGMSSISDTTLKQLFANCLYELSGAVRDPRHWLRRMGRLLERPIDEGPVLTIFFDGLNQESTAPWLRILKVLQSEVFSGRVRVVASTRRHHFEDKLSKLNGLSVAPVQVLVDRYNDNEIDQMLQYEGLSRPDLHPEVLDLARTPRLFNLVVQLRERLVEAGQITVHRLLWEYGRDTLGVRAEKSFSENEWRDWLKVVAEKYRTGLTGFSAQDLSATVHRHDLTISEVYARLSDLIDGPFARPRISGNLISPEMVAHALGLALLEYLKSIESPTFEALDDALKKWLDPIAGLDQSAEILRASVSILVELGDAAVPALPGVLLTAWLQAHNVAEEHRREVVFLAPNFPDALLDVIEHSETLAHDSARSWAVKALREIPRSNKESLGAIVRRVPRWLAVVYRDPRLGSATNQVLDEQRSEHLQRLVGTDASGFISIIGLDIEIADHSPDSAKAVIPSILQGFPLSEALPVFQAAAVELALNSYSKYWESLEWLCLLNEVDPQETAIGLRNLAQEIAIRQPGSGIHPDLPKRIAALLLGLTGQPADDEAAADLEPHIGGRPRYEEDYLPQPSRSFWFPLERRHAKITLNDTDIVLQSRVQKIGDLWFDPEFEPPGSFVAELRNEAARIDVTKLNSNRWQTREDVQFEALEPALARCAPDFLADLVRRKMQSLETCPPESHYSKAMNVTDHLLLAGDAEAVAAKTLRSNICEKDRINRLAAENGLLVTEIQALDALQQIDTLIRADLPDFLIDSGAILRPLTPTDVEELFSRYATGSEKQQLDFFKLLSFQPEHIRRDSIWSWVEGFRTIHRDHRGFVFKTLVEADLMRFGLLLLEEGWSWDPAEDIWVNHYGTDALIEAASSLAFEELAPRLAPWRLLEAARRRGADPTEVRLAAEIFTYGLLAYGVEELDPGADLSIDLSTEKHWPFRYSVQARRNDDEYENLLMLTRQDPEDELQATRRSIETAASRIRDARQSGAKLFQAILASEDFEPVLRHARDRVKQWVEGCSGPTADFQRRVRLAEGAFLALCEALLKYDPEQGSQLWRALRFTMTTRYIGEAGVNDLLHMVFRAPDSPAVSTLRHEIAELECCHTDQELFELAIAASCNGKIVWLNETIEADRVSAYAWRRQRAKVLKGFTIDNTLPISGAWPEGELKTSDARLARISARFRSIEACARHWWRTYLEASEPVEAYAAWTLFLRSADRRSLLWMRKDADATGQSDNFSELKKGHAHLNRKNLERAMERREEGPSKFSQNFLFRRISQDISPWIW